METFISRMILTILTAIVTTIVNAFVFSKLWLWFVAPTLNLPSLKIIEAAGIMLFIAFIQAERKPKEAKVVDTGHGDFWPQFGSHTALILGIAGMSLFFGWIVKLLI